MNDIAGLILIILAFIVGAWAGALGMETYQAERDPCMYLFEIPSEFGAEGWASMHLEECREVWNP